MLVYIINTLFKNNKIKDSLEYAEKLKLAMEEYNRLLYDKYLFFYYNSLVINYSKSDRERTIEILEEMRSLEKIVSVLFYEVFISLNLAVSYFEIKDYHQSIRNLNLLYTLKGYPSTDLSLQFKIAIVELMIRYELKDFDILENKIRLIKKDFSEFFKKPSSERDVLMVEVIQRLMKSDRHWKEKVFFSNVKQNILSPLKKEAADADIINYKNWLDQKM